MFKRYGDVTCTTQDEDKTLEINKRYEVRDISYRFNEILIFNPVKQYVIWYPCRLFNIQNAEQIEVNLI